MAAIALVDDHGLLRNGLAALIKSLGHTVLFEADNGKELIEKLNAANLPDIILMDINMPDMNGYETTLWLKQNHPQVKVLALSMYDSETAILRMMKCGARGFILKDSKPAILKEAIESLITNGRYHSELVNDKIVEALLNTEQENIVIKSLGTLSAKEALFLNLICTGLTYEEIADKMQLSKRTVEKYRDTLFNRLKVKNRLELAMFAVKNGLVKL
jgi:two-component system, NarL family, invasion response regulator UvrY